MCSRRLASVVGLGALAFTLPIGVGGQTQKPAGEQPQLLLATVVTVKPGMSTEYVELQTKEVMPAQRKGGSTGREAWSSAVFGTAGTYAYFTPVSSVAQFDSPGPLVKTLGQEAAAALNARVGKLIDGSRTMLVRTRPDLSYAPDPTAAPAALALVSEVEVAPGRRADFEAVLKREVIPAMQQAKVRRYTVLEVLYGGSASRYFSAIGYDTFDAMAKGHPFTVVLGEEGARKLEAKFTGVVTRLDRFMMRQRPELSWKPGQTIP